MAIPLKLRIKYFRFNDAVSWPPGLWIYCWGQNSVPINSQSELSNTNYMRTISRRNALVYRPVFVISQLKAPNGKNSGYNMSQYKIICESI